MPGEFKDRIVVVTGGSRGIGLGIAEAFAREGAQTVLCSSSETNLSAAAKTMAAAEGPAPLTIAGDLRTSAGCESVFARVRERFGRCDVLVNCAGATKAGAFLELSDADWLDGFALKSSAACVSHGCCGRC
jgi:NAD(P)-dependent dehydrogenase (short-subunit alcohol dehydrogenase family)